MIQRKQTLFLLLIILISSICLFTNPFIYNSISFINIEKSIANVGLKATLINHKFYVDNWIISILLVLISMLSIFTIISFKNLKRQIKLSIYTIATSILCFISCFYTIYTQTEKIKFFDGSFVLNGWVYLILIFILSILAFRFIKKDIELLDSVDRLR